MLKLLIFIGVIYLLYRGLKSWMLPDTANRKAVFDKSADKIDDIMIKDPFCEAYFPKRNGVRLRFNGEDLYFCSTECRDKFLESRSKRNN